MRRLPILLCVLAYLASGVAHAQSPGSTVGGKYSASSLKSSWRLGDWGPACGPQPSGGGEAGGTVTVTDEGKALAMSGLGRAYKTNQCWEQLPGLQTQSASSGGSTYRTVCKNAPGDPRQATITTTWTVRPDALYFDETGQYQFVVEGQNCTASVRRTRVLTRIVEPTVPPTATPEPPIAPTTSVTVPEAPAEPEPSRCAEPGPPHRLEVSPAEKLMLPGEQFSFRTIVRDEAGCRLKTPPKWAIERGSELGRLVGPGTLETLPGAADGIIALRATLGGKSVDVTAQVVSKERYEALLAAGDYGASGESKGSAVTTLAGSTIDAKAQVVQGKSGRLAWLVVAAGGVLLALVTTWLLIDRKRQAARRAAAAETKVAAHPRPAPAPPEPSKVCPLCGEIYPPGTEFCGKDGAQLLRMN